ncbi:hypothetical protein LCGC14_0996040 [marine sediment metagenome]|uniref:Uncharacterized protein n=1 Tax=marine sediment metagenome TaxID=412755 RepID=A0A0F9NQW4_9ZZZZ
MYCETHPKYNPYRRPSGNYGCLSCWRVYLDEKDKFLPDYIRSVASKNQELAEYLLENQSNIMLAPVVQEASIESDIEFSNVDELVADGFKDAFGNLPEDVKEETKDVVEKPILQRGKFV